jgi:tripartite-type tricarboxylate transporter receptor subunit TctC
VNPFTLAAACLGALLAPLSAGAQAYPTKPVRIVTQFAPGSSGDTSLRIIAPVMSQDLGQPVVVDNRAGGGGVVAAEQVVRAAPDGYTLLNGTSASHIIRPFLARETSFDPLRDLTPITALYTSITLVVAHPSVPFNNAREMIDYARRNPGKLSYGSSGIGTDHHLSGEEINILTGAGLVHVPYKATAQALIDVVSGQIPMTFAITSAVAPFVKSGKVKVIAVNRNNRTALFPDVASLEETIPKYQTPPSWTALFGPAGLPQPIVARLHAAAVKGLRAPEAQSRWEANGSEVLGNTPEQFAALLKSEIALVAGIVKAAGIRPE